MASAGYETHSSLTQWETSLDLNVGVFVVIILSLDKWSHANMFQHQSEEHKNTILWRSVNLEQTHDTLNMMYDKWEQVIKLEFGT